MFDSDGIVAYAVQVENDKHHKIAFFLSDSAPVVGEKYKITFVVKEVCRRNGIYDGKVIVDQSSEAIESC
jgi:hypothetical protein